MLEAINIHSEYLIRIGFPRHRWLHERVSMLDYTHIARSEWNRLETVV